ncbi:MAG: hypothetical protein CR982_07615 [Candidatus Cloacimonadota bacterium]|nr:MAG: hypothetical protein CR982_07615 [Candidatus Cloacimonadota bacterium]PIE78278.1 MAG: hypothetical protein CSA15_08925 [Candidatus Delongbacteria bacterium]
MKSSREYAWEILPRLLDKESIAGYCEKAILFLEEELKKFSFEHYRTNKGGLIIKLGGKDKSKSRVLSAHVDTLGGMVKSIGGNGRVFITPIGGIAAVAAEGEYVTIETSSGKKIKGSVIHNNPSAHVNKSLSTEERTYSNLSVRVDEKVFNEEDVKNLGIGIGDYVFFDPRVEVTESGFIKSRFLDDKAGVAALFGSLKYFEKNRDKIVYDTYYYISVAEEVGNGMVSMIPENCFELVAVDMGALGEGQTSDEYTVSICAKDSSGPFNYELRKKIVSIAESKNIPYKVDIYPYYGSDAAAALRTGVDAKHILFGPGIDASHSYERVHKTSLDATTDLIIHYLLSE